MPRRRPETGWKRRGVRYISRQWCKASSWPGTRRRFQLKPLLPSRVSVDQVLTCLIYQSRASPRSTFDPRPVIVHSRPTRDVSAEIKGKRSSTSSSFISRFLPTLCHPFVTGDTKPWYLDPRSVDRQRFGLLGAGRTWRREESDHWPVDSLLGLCKRGQKCRGARRNGGADGDAFGDRRDGSRRMVGD